MVSSAAFACVSLPIVSVLWGCKLAAIAKSVPFTPAASHRCHPCHEPERRTVSSCATLHRASRPDGRPTDTTRHLHCPSMPISSRPMLPRCHACRAVARSAHRAHTIDKMLGTSASTLRTRPRTRRICAGLRRTPHAATQTQTRRIRRGGWVFTPRVMRAKNIGGGPHASSRMLSCYVVFAFCAQTSSAGRGGECADGGCAAPWRDRSMKRHR